MHVHACRWAHAVVIGVDTRGSVERSLKEACTGHYTFFVPPAGHGPGCAFLMGASCRSFWTAHAVAGFSRSG